MTLAKINPLMHIIKIRNYDALFQVFIKHHYLI